MKRGFALVSLLAFLTWPAHAQQQQQFKVVPACPSTTAFQSASGGYGAAAVDVDGNLCLVSTSPTTSMTTQQPQPSPPPDGGAQ